MFVYFKGNIDTLLIKKETHQCLSILKETLIRLYLFSTFSFQFSILTQSFNIAINDVYILRLWFFWQTWHTHDVAHNDNDHLCAIVDDDISYVEVEVLRNAVSFWIC